MAGQDVTPLHLPVAIPCLGPGFCLPHHYGVPLDLDPIQTPGLHVPPGLLALFPGFEGPSDVVFLVFLVYLSFPYSRPKTLPLTG